MKYYIYRFKKYDTKEGIIISVWKKDFFVFNKIITENIKSVIVTGRNEQLQLYREYCGGVDAAVNGVL